MTDKINYKDQYRHPNWQKKRLDALNHYKFTCQMCNSTEKQLHVHHKLYIKGRLVWDYSVEELDVLCDDCHSIAHAMKDELHRLVSSIPSADLSSVIGLIAGFLGEKVDDSQLDILRSYDIESALPVGSLAKAAHDYLTKTETQYLTNTIINHERLDSSTTEITIAIGKKYGFGG